MFSFGRARNQNALGKISLQQPTWNRCDKLLRNHAVVIMIIIIMIILIIIILITIMIIII